jgi:hypothetical protein
MQNHSVTDDYVAEIFRRAKFGVSEKEFSFGISIEEMDE